VEGGLGEQVGQDVEDAQQPVAGVLESLQAGGDPGLAGGVAPLEVGPDQLVLAAEGAVQRGLGHAGPLDDAVDAHHVDALVVEELVGRVEEAIPGRGPFSSFRGHGVDDNRPVCLSSTPNRQIGLST
jgi:hypothetical protein